MKKSIIFLVMLVSVISTYSQNKTIIIAETTLPYYNQTWFYSGSGNALQESEIQKYWDEGKRITSAAYTNNGWFLVMSKGSAIGMQCYKLSSTWPNEWIKENWNKNYNITSISYGKGQWLVVMSQGTDESNQTWSRNYWNNTAQWIKENWNNGLYITNTCFDGNLWTIVMGKHLQFASQGYLFADNYSDLQTKIKSNVWDKGNCVQQIEFADGKYFVVYCKYKEANNRIQSWIVNPQDVNNYIQNRWDSSQNIAYIGGGYSSVNNNIPTYPSPREFYLANDKGTISHTTIREFEDTWKHQLERQIIFWCYDGDNHYFLYDRVRDGWYIYRGYDVAASIMKPTKYIDEWLHVKGDFSCVELVYSDGRKKKFDKASTKEKYLEYDRKVRAAENGVIFFGDDGGSVNSGSIKNSNTRNNSSSSYSRCKYCGGGGGCSSCNGTGHKFNGYSGHEDSCPSCRGTGRCQICRGTGRL